jgi:uncharacterized protein (UPF0261 family)
VSQTAPRVLVIGTLDTKGPETAFLASRIREHGCETTVLDSGILGEAIGIEPDFSRRAVAEAAGATIDALRQAGTRGAAVEQMLIGVRRIALDEHRQGRVDAVVALGGAEGTVLAAAAMTHLPVGVPKLIVSPIASGRRSFGPFVGTRDVTVMHSVVDILGLNSVSIPVFENAAAAVSGMAHANARRRSAPAPPRPNQIAATMLGNTTRPLMQIKDRLAERRLDLVIFHANGTGGRAMEELVAQRQFAGVLDYTVSEIIGEIAGGFHRGGPDRMTAAGRAGLPQIVVPGCVDFIVFGPRHDVPDALRERPSYYHNPEFTLVRASREEQLAAAEAIARALNASPAPVSVLVPVRGLSIPNVPGGAFWDPDLDAAFRESLRGSLNANIQYREEDVHINDETFARSVADEALRVFAGTTFVEAGA